MAGRKVAFEGRADVHACMGHGIGVPRRRGATGAEVHVRVFVRVSVCVCVCASAPLKQGAGTPTGEAKHMSKAFLPPGSREPALKETRELRVRGSAAPERGRGSAADDNGREREERPVETTSARLSLTC